MAKKGDRKIGDYLGEIGEGYISADPETGIVKYHKYDKDGTVEKGVEITKEKTLTEDK